VRESPGQVLWAFGFAGLGICGARRSTSSFQSGGRAAVASAHYLGCNAPPYHALRSATGRNWRQAFWLVSAASSVGRFAAGCVPLPPLGSIRLIGQGRLIPVDRHDTRRIGSVRRAVRSVSARDAARVRPSRSALHLPTARVSLVHADGLQLRSPLDPERSLPARATPVDHREGGAVSCAFEWRRNGCMIPRSARHHASSFLADQ